MGRVYAVASAKGGVGKTTTTANLGATLAAAGYDVVVVDADLGMANLGGALSVGGAGGTVHDVLGGDATVEQATYEGPHGLRVLPGSDELGSYAGADPAGLGDLVEALSGYDYVLVDTGAGLSHDSVLPLGVADEVLLVSTASRDAVGDTAKTVQVAGRLGASVAGVVVTRVIDGQDPEDAAERIGADLLTTVPEDVAVRHATEHGQPLTVDAPDSPAAAAYRTLAEVLTGESIPGPEPVATEAESVDPDEPEDGDDAAPPAPRPLDAETTAAVTERPPEAETPDPRPLDAETTAALTERPPEAETPDPRPLDAETTAAVTERPPEAETPDPRPLDAETTAALSRTAERDAPVEEAEDAPDTEAVDVPEAEDGADDLDAAATAELAGPRVLSEETTPALTRHEPPELDETAAVTLETDDVAEAETEGVAIETAEPTDEGTAGDVTADTETDDESGPDTTADDDSTQSEGDDADVETTVPEAEGEGNGVDEDGVTFPETEPLEEDALDMDDDEGVFDTSFVEQAEELEREASEEATETPEEAEGKKKDKGFFKRLFGGD